MLNTCLSYMINIDIGFYKKVLIKRQRISFLYTTCYFMQIKSYNLALVGCTNRVYIWINKIFSELENNWKC